MRVGGERASERAREKERERERESRQTGRGAGGGGGLRCRDDVPLMEFVYHVFIRMPGES